MNMRSERSCRFDALRSVSISAIRTPRGGGRGGTADWYSCRHEITRVAVVRAVSCECRRAALHSAWRPTLRRTASSRRSRHCCCFCCCCCCFRRRYCCFRRRYRFFCRRRRFATVEMTVSPSPLVQLQAVAVTVTTTTVAFRLSLVMLLLLDVGTASASICKSGLCSREQYCCGDGKCCDNVYSLWYLCGGVAVMLFVVGSFCPVIRQCCCFRTPVIVKYVPVPTSPTKFKYSDHEKCTRVDVTLPMPPQATTMGVTNCI